MKNSRGKNAKLNMLTGVLQEVVALVCGLILPRIVLGYFGSAYNGLINSITHFLSFSTVLRSGIGAATHVALYKPLADGDNDAVSGIMSATSGFMRKVGFILAGLILGLAVLYPLAVLDEFDYLFTASLIIIIGISSFAESMFSVKLKILLQADQKYYIQTIVAIFAQILTTVISVVLIYSGATIHIVKLGAAAAYFTTPLLLGLYVKKNYNINWKAKPNNAGLKQRWDAFAHQLATIVNDNVDSITVSLLCGMLEASVYSVYFMVVNNIRKLMAGFLNGIKSTFGNMMVKKETETLKSTFKSIEFALFAGCTVIFSVTAIMVTPFVLLYADNVSDVNYNRVLFGVLMSVAFMMNVLRVPYQSIVEAAGHFKQTKAGAILEVVVHISLSVILSFFFGIEGVVIGALVAALIRTTQFAWYSNVKLLGISILPVIKNYIVYFATMIALAVFVPKYVLIPCDSVLEWIINGFISFGVCVAATLLVSAIFNRNQLVVAVKYFRKRIFKK